MWVIPQSVLLTDDVVHETASSEDLEMDTVGRVIAHELWREVAALPPFLRDVTVLRFGLAGAEQRSCRETGRVLGTTHPTVRKAERDALALLRGRFVA